MDIWRILGIEQTTDKEAIAAAYRNKLTVTNPEDKPKEFMELRAAYEDALKYANEADTSSDDETLDESLWINRFKKIYDDFFRRINEETWREFFHSDSDISLVKNLELRDELIKFLMGNNAIPQPVWQVFDEVFDFTSSRADLIEAYPPDFIDNILLASVRFPQNINYSLFIEGNTTAQYDDFIILYNRANNMLNRGEIADARPYLTELQNHSVHHPYLKMLEYRFLMIDEKVDEAKVKAKEFLDECPDDIEALLMYAEHIRVSDKDFTNSKEIYEKILESEPERYNARFGLACCLIENGEYLKAKDILYALMDIAPYDGRVSEQLDSANNLLVTRLEEVYKENPNDTENAIELSWCYLQLNRSSEAISVAGTIDPTDTDSSEYENLMSKIYFFSERYEEAEEHFTKLRDILSGLVDDGTEEYRKKLRRYVNCLKSLAAIRAIAKDNEEALKIIDQALVEMPLNDNFLLAKTSILFDLRRYTDVIELCDRITNITLNEESVIILKGASFYKLGMMQQAFDCFNRGIRLNASNLVNYLYKIRILLEVEEWKLAEEVIDFLHNSGVETDTLRYFDARILEHNENTKLAFDTYLELIKNHEDGNGDNNPFMYEVYLRAAVGYMENKNLAEALSVIDKGTKSFPEEIVLLQYKGYLLVEDNKSKEALDCYKRILEIDSRHSFANQRIARIYFDVYKDRQKALEYFLLQNKVSESVYNYRWIGRCYYYLEQYDKSRTSYETALKLDPTDVYTLFYAADLEREERYFLEGETLYRKAIEEGLKQNDPDEDLSFLYYQLARMYMRSHQADKAVSVLTECNNSKYGDYRDFNRLYEIYKFFGCFDEADAMLKAWQKNSNGKVTTDMVRYEQALIDEARGNRTRSIRILKHLKEPNSRVLNLGITYFFNDDFMKAYSKFLEFNKLEPDNYGGLIWLARVTFFLGKLDNSRYFAQKAYDIAVSDGKTADIGYETLYSVWCAEATGYLGHIDEALNMLSKLRKGRLCNHCDFARCKDIELITAQLLEMQGKFSEALSIYTKCMVEFPSDRMFKNSAENLRRKGYTC